MTAVVASAPGKIVICGEYAVLDGAPAICMAVDKRARAVLRTSDTQLQAVRTSGYIDGEWKFTAGPDGEFEWVGDEPAAGSLDLLREVWVTMGVSGNFDIELDTAKFIDPLSKLKLGFGSSAAMTVALVAALSRITGRVDTVARDAAEAHRRLQHGRGSGVDVAASLSGGVVEYRMNRSANCRPVSWPAGLEYAVLWSGQPASTSDKLKKLDQARREERSGTSAVELCGASEVIARCWSAGSTDQLVAELPGYIDALRKFDVDHDLGIFDAGHQELADAAARRKLIYKPCGAGGGDVGIVLATDREAVAEFAADSGYEILEVSLESRGVIVES